MQLQLHKQQQFLLIVVNDFWSADDGNDSDKSFQMSTLVTHRNLNSKTLHFFKFLQQILTTDQADWMLQIKRAKFIVLALFILIEYRSKHKWTRKWSEFIPSLSMVQVLIDQNYRLLTGKVFLVNWLFMSYGNV